MEISLRNKYILIISTYLLILISLKYGKNIPGINSKNIFIIVILELVGCISIFYIFIKEKINYEFLTIFFLATLFWDLALFSKTTNKQNLHIIIEGTFILNLSFFLMTAKTFIQNINKLKAKNIFREFKNLLFKNKYLILIIFLFAFFSIDIFTTWLQSDGYDYYSGVNWCTSWDFADMNKLMLSGHNSQGYVFFILMAEFFYPNAVVATRLINIILAIITIVALNEIINVVFKDASESEKALYLGIFAFSPILFSMMAEVNIDYALLCFMIWLVSSYLNKKYILQTFCGLLICFSKEPGLLVYGLFIIGLFVKNIIDYFCSKNDFSFTDMLKNIISIPLLINCFGGCAWLSFYFFKDAGIGWSDVYAAEEIVHKDLNKINTFGFNIEYIIFKIEQLFIMNFSWIFVAIIISGIIFTIYNKFKYKLHLKFNTKFVPIIFVAFSTLIYNLIFITWTNYRYLIPAIFFIILISLLFIYKSKLKKIYKKIILIFLLIITFISNYVTDPVSQNVFIDFNTSSNAKMIITPRFSVTDGYVCMKDESIMNKWGWCDTMVYNKQYTYWGHVFDEFLDEIEYDENKIIIMPLILSSDISMYSRFFGRSQKCIEKTVWNKQSGHIEYNTFQGLKTFDNAKLNIKFEETSSYVNIKDYNEYSEVYFVELPLENNKNMLKNVDVLDSKKYKYLTCEIKVSKLK